jgi:hypothetical protein
LTVCDHFSDILWIDFFSIGCGIFSIELRFFSMRRSIVASSSKLRCIKCISGRNFIIRYWFVPLIKIDNLCNFPIGVYTYLARS